jgi:hypothetical protein
MPQKSERCFLFIPPYFVFYFIFPFYDDGMMLLCSNILYECCYILLFLVNHRNKIYATHFFTTEQNDIANNVFPCVSLANEEKVKQTHKST